MKAQKTFTLDQHSASTYYGTKSSTSTQDSSEESDMQEEAGDDENLNDMGDIDIADVKLNQLRRGTTRKRRQRGNQYNRLEGLQSFDALKKSHSLKRMEEGLRNILALHTPVELSSICGCLQLKAQQKAATSIEQIVKYVLKTEDFDLPTIEQVLGFMWEGALWEYLHRIGHPIHSTRVDPRRTVMDVWEKGGLLSNGSLFVPHFIAREVKKRNEWVTSPDILQRIEQIRQAQDLAKSAEKKIIADHDYTNILTYFKEMAKLRSLENSVREYLISELEIARSRIDSSQDTVLMLREQLKENENLFIVVTEQLNVDLASSEQVCKHNIKRRFQMEEAVCRLNSILESYLETEMDRFTPGGGILQPLKVRQIEDFPPMMRQTFDKIQTYRDLRDAHDDELRFRARCHIEEVQQLREKLQELEIRLEKELQEKSHLNTSFDKLVYENALLQRQTVRDHQRFAMEKAILWKQAISNSQKVTRYQQQLQKLKPFLKAAACHSNSFVQDLSLTLLDHLRLIRTGEEEHRELLETMQMKRQDVIDYYVRELEIRARRDAERMANASSKGKKTKAPKGGSTKEKDKEKDKDKKKLPEKDEERTVTSKTKSPSAKPQSASSKKKK